MKIHHMLFLYILCTVCHFAHGASMEEQLQKIQKSNAAQIIKWTGWALESVVPIKDLRSLIMEYHGEPTNTSFSYNTSLDAIKRFAQVCPGIVNDYIIDGQNNDGDTFLHLAVESDRVRLVEGILTLNPNVNIQNNLGWTPLHNVQSVAVAKLLCDARADVNLADNNLRDACFQRPQLPEPSMSNLPAIALCKKRTQLVDFLSKVKQSSPVMSTALNPYKRTGKSLDLSWFDEPSPELSQAALAEAPRSRPVPNPNDPFEVFMADDAIEKSPTGISQFMDEELRKGKRLVFTVANKDFPDKHFKTVLHYAAAKGAQRGPSVTSLLGLSANPNARDCNERTPLHYVVAPVHAQQLIAKKADVGARDNEGKTVLHHLMTRQLVDKKDFREHLKMLTTQNPNIVNVVDDNGNAPLHYVSDLDQVGLLVASKADVLARNNSGQNVAVTFLNRFYFDPKMQIEAPKTPDDSDDIESGSLGDCIAKKQSEFFQQQSRAMEKNRDYEKRYGRIERLLWGYIDSAYKPLFGPKDTNEKKQDSAVLGTKVNNSK